MNVTQLVTAVLDPDWRQQWIAGKNPLTPKPQSPPGSFPVNGQRFHSLVYNFTEWLCAAKAKKTAAKLATADALWHECYHRFAEAELTKLALSDKLESAHHLSLCLQAFCARLSELRQARPDFGNWQDLFLADEMNVKDVPVGPGLWLSGRIDAVRTDPAHGAVVVDYKLSHGSNAKNDLVQLAIYAHLLEKTRPGLTFTGLLEYYEPQLSQLSVAPEDLRGIFNDLVAPVIQELAGNVGGISGAHPPKPHHAQPDLSQQIIKTFANFKLEVTVTGKVEAPQLVRYALRPGPGVKVVSLANRADDLQVNLALPTPPRIEAAQGCVTIDVPKEKPDAVLWRNIRNDPALVNHPSRVAFPVGLGVDGKLILCDFADSNTCHALVAGTSGSGKSEFLKSLVASLLVRNDPSTLRLSLIDPKILTFGEIEGSPHLTGPIITHISEAIPCLEGAADEMDQRYQQFKQEGFNNLGQRFQAGMTDIPFHLILFDEFADLVLAGKEEKKAFENLVARLAAKGRASGIHLVLATQRPDSTIVTGPIKANLPLKVCLRVTNATNSKIILDEPGGEALVGRGDLLCDRGKGGVERAQSPFLPPGELAGLVWGLDPPQA